jgi:formylglycine-generating enzyme required for sulfatase activity
MKIFLSYASQDSEVAKSIYLALRDQGHKVFFDRADLPAGEEFHNRIRAAIEGAHLFIFLISANALDAGSYTLTEMSIAESAKIALLPVALGKVDVATLPAFLKSVTVLETDGNLPAAVGLAVHGLARDRQWRRGKYLAAAMITAAIVAATIFYAGVERVKTTRTGKDGAPAILVPAGTFIMGDDEESPRRELFVAAFYMDKYEVTVARYANFMKATGNLKTPEEWDTVDLKANGALPVVGVDWYDASSYCQWAGKRLPTETEWEKSARGTDERKFPWGNDPPTPEHARFLMPYQNAVYKDGVSAVGSKPKGASALGIDDLAGNVWEWVEDWYSESFPSADRRYPKGPNTGTGKVLRGGGWYDPAERLTSTKRMHAAPEHRDDSVGFRCASDAQ